MVSEMPFMLNHFSVAVPSSYRNLFSTKPQRQIYSSLKKPCLGAVFTFFWNVAVIRSGTTETDGNTDV